jgi:hypothetical protein
MKVRAPRFDLDECRNEAEKEFIEALHARAEAGGWFADAWPHPSDNRIIVTVDVCDPDHNSILRMLRVDYDGATLTVGPDETYQLASHLDPSRADVMVMSGQAPAVLASAAADWLEHEVQRPIERREWDRPTFRHRQWLLADTGKKLVFSDSKNSRRSDFELGPPDRIVPVRREACPQPE